MASTWLARAKPGQQVPVFVRRSTFKLPRDPATPIVMVGPGTGLAPFRGFLQERAALARAGAALGPALLFFGCRSRASDYIYQKELEEAVAGGALTSLHVALSRDGERASERATHGAAEGFPGTCLTFRPAAADPVTMQAGWRHTLTPLPPSPPLPPYVPPSPALHAPHPGSAKDYVQHHMEAHADAVWGLLCEERGGVLYVCGDAKHMAKDVHRTLAAIAARAAGATPAQGEAAVKRLSDAGRYLKDVW